MNCRRLCRRAGVAIFSLLLVLAGLSSTATAHEDGLIELWVAEVRVTEAPAGEVRISADLVDRDSASIASGFAAEVEVRNEADELIERIDLAESGAGTYEGVMGLGAGSWTLTINVEQGDSPLPALKSDRRVQISVDETGAVEIASSGGIGGIAFVLIVGLGAVLILGVILLFRGSGSAADKKGGRAKL